NMKGRIYDPKTARFLTPDPLVSAPATSVAYNRYAYAFQNPTRWVDPSGLAPIGGDPGLWDTPSGCQGPAEDPSCRHVTDPDWWSRGNVADIGSGRAGGGQAAKWEVYFREPENARVFEDHYNAAAPTMAGGSCDESSCGGVAQGAKPQQQQR